MNHHDLAGKGILPSQKKEVLQRLLAEKEQIIASGNEREANLGLAKGCMDIINTARAACSRRDCTPDQEVEWKALLDDVIILAKESICIEMRKSTKGWLPYDYAVVGAVMVLTAERDETSIEQAIELINRGLEVAMAAEDKRTVIMLRAQLLNAVMANGYQVAIVQAMQDLARDFYVLYKELDLDVISFVHCSMAAAHKSLAICVAKRGGLEDRLLMSEAI